MLAREHPARAEEASFFYASSFFREGDWTRSRREFKRFVRRFPSGRFVPPAYWHLATCDVNAGRVSRPLAEFRRVIRHAGDDVATRNMAASEMEVLRRPRGGMLIDWRRWRRT